MLRMGCGLCNGECGSADVSGGDCMHEQSTSESEKTDACDCCQNQMEHGKSMCGVSPNKVSTV